MIQHYEQIESPAFEQAHSQVLYINLHYYYRTARPINIRKLVMTIESNKEHLAIKNYHYVSISLYFIQRKYMTTKDIKIRKHKISYLGVVWP